MTSDRVHGARRIKGLFTGAYEGAGRAPAFVPSSSYEGAGARHMRVLVI
jgi:hypothetical protein